MWRIKVTRRNNGIGSATMRNTTWNVMDKREVGGWGWGERKKGVSYSARVFDSAPVRISVYPGRKWKHDWWLGLVCIRTTVNWLTSGLGVTQGGGRKDSGEVVQVKRSMGLFQHLHVTKHIRCQFRTFGALCTPSLKDNKGICDKTTITCTTNDILLFQVCPRKTTSLF